MLMLDTLDEGLVEALYLAGRNPRHWQDFLAQLVQACDAQHAVLYLVLGSEGRRHELVFHHDALRGGAMPDDDAGAASRLAEARARTATERGGRRMIQIARRDDGNRLALLLSRAADRPPFSDDATGRMDRLGPFLRQVLRAANDDRRQAVAESHLDGLNALAMACLLFDARDGLVFANDAAWALLTASDAMRVVDGRLQFQEKRCQLALDAALLEFSRPSPRDARPVIDIAVGQKSGTIWLALVTPVIAEGGEAGAHRAIKTAVYILAAGSHDRPGTGVARLCRLYGLTVAEAEITVQLLHGKTAKTIAGDRGVSLHTVRGQIKQILDKTQSKGQAGLFRLQGFFEA